jgi:hypothetical protein
MPDQALPKPCGPKYYNPLDSAVPPEAGRLTGNIDQPEASSPPRKPGPSCPNFSVTNPLRWFTQSLAIEVMEGRARAAKAKLFRFDSPMRRASLAAGDFATELLQYGDLSKFTSTGLPGLKLAEKPTLRKVQSQLPDSRSFVGFRIGGDSPGTTDQRTHDSTPAASGQTGLSVTWY